MAEVKKPTNFNEWMTQFQADQGVATEDPAQETNKDNTLVTEDESEELNQEEVAEDVNLEEAGNEEDATEVEEDDSSESNQPQDEEDSDESEEEDEEISFDDWDNVETAEDEDEPSVDYSELAKEFGFEGIETREGLSEAIKTLKRESEELRTQSETYSSIPDDLKEAIQLYKKGGDYLSYLGVTSNDYSQYSDRDLVANSIAHHFKNEDGSINEEELTDYLDGMSDKALKIEGGKIRESLVNSQKAQKQRIEQQAEQARKEQKAQLKKALDGIKEVDKFKLTPSHKKQIFDKVMKGDMLKDLFYNKNGELDYGKVAQVYFRELNRDKINKFFETKIKNSTRKEVWRSTTNTQLDKPTTKSNPDTKQKSGLDAYFEQLTKR